MVDFSRLKTFVLICETGSMASVARKLGISPAAVSKQLTKLEEESGIRLLRRSTRCIEFTDIGRSYYLQCRRILEEVEEATALISHVKVDPEGILRVVAARSFGLTHLVPHMEEFLSEYPKIDLDMELAERIPDLNIEEIDVSIGMSISAAGDVIQKRIATTSYAFCASPDYLERFGAPKKIEDLKNHRYITHSMRLSADEVHRSGKVVSVSPYIRVNDTEAMLYFALKGSGIVMLHRYAVQKYLDSGALNELFRSSDAPEVPIYVAYRAGRYVSSKVRTFIDFMTKKLSE